MDPEENQRVLFREPSEDFQQTEVPSEPWKAPRKPTRAVNLKPLGRRKSKSGKAKISAKKHTLKKPAKKDKKLAEEVIKKLAEEEEIKKLAEEEEIKKKLAEEEQIKELAEEQMKPRAEEVIKQLGEEGQSIVKRAKGRAKVPDKFSDGVKRFFFSPTGILKILRMDLINSIISSVFLLVVASFAMQEKKRRHLFYVGGSLCLTAAIVCGIDACVVTKTMRNNMKRVLGIKTKN
ncbi:chemokine-like factor isoform X1 [Nycticebus coucang]|uniref:chemokine-like factor isoform X1 n=1 Tax=Nycticebus coucang TaxID=9470 RepID=UPI00234DC330|nr:chemokine-like factor isoform X1 [Nycticebus coucang]